MQGSDDYHPVAPRFIEGARFIEGFEFKANIAIVAPHQNLRLGIAVDAIALFNQANERLTLVGFAIKSPQSALVNRLIYKNMGCDQHPSHQFDRRRRKGNLLAKLTRSSPIYRGSPIDRACDSPKLLHEFGGVTMPRRLK